MCRAAPLLTCPARQVNKHGGAGSGGRIGADGGRCFMRFLVINVSLRLVVGGMEGKKRWSGMGRGGTWVPGRGAAYTPPLHHLLDCPNPDTFGGAAGTQGCGWWAAPETGAGGVGGGGAKIHYSPRTATSAVEESGAGLCV